MNAVLTFYQLPEAMMAHQSRRLAQAVTTFALLLGPAALYAQAGPILSPGTRVRVTTQAVADTLVVGSVVSTTQAMLTVAPASGRPYRVAVPIASIQRLEVSRGRSAGSRQHVLIGAILGAGAGALGGYGLASLGSCSGLACGAGDALGAIAGGLVGLFIGGMVGEQMGAGPERWEERPVDVQPAGAR